MIESAWECFHHAVILLIYTAVMTVLYTEGSNPWKRDDVSNFTTSNHITPASTMARSSELVAFDFVSNLLQWHRHYCGYNRVCENYSPSLCYRCAPCRCDKICHAFGDCCPDITVNSQRSGEYEQRSPLTFAGKHATVQECRNVDVSPSRLMGVGNTEQNNPRPYRQTKNADSSANRFFMITRCPSNSVADLIKKCSQVEGEPPVTSAKYSGKKSIVFKNIFCAHCNGIYDVISWDISVICPMSSNTSLHTLLRASLYTFLERDCNVIYSPPRDTPYRQCYTQPNMISKCNKTGEWRTYNAFVDRACGSYTTLKFAQGKAYKNIFCYLCNQKDDSFDPDLGKCALDSSQGETSFEARISHKQMDTAGSPSGSYISSNGYEECGGGSGVYDSKEKKCRDVSCAFGQRLNGSSTYCQPAFGDVKGLTYELYFKIKLDVPIPLSGKYDYIHHLPSETEIMLRQKLRLNKVKIEDFAMAFNTTTDNGRCSQFSNNLALYARIKCHTLTNQADLQERLMALRHQVFHVDNGQWNITMKSIPSEMPWHLMVPHRQNSPHSLSSCIAIVAKNSRSIRKDGTKRVGTTTPDPVTVRAKMMSPPDLRISNLLTCPRVKLLTWEFTFSGVGKELRLSWREEPLSGTDYLVDSDGSITVCLSTYLTKLNKSSRRTSAEIVCAVTLLLLSVVFLLICLVVHAIVPALRSIPGKNNAILVLCLVSAQIAIWIGYIVPYHSTLCTAMGIFCHYFSLCSFLSLVICSYHLYTVFVTMHLAVDIAKENKTFILYCCCIFLPPAVVIIVLMSVAKSTDLFLTSTGYGSSALCFLTSSTATWLALFLPLIVSAAAAFVLFLLTYSALQSNADVETNIVDERHVYFHFRASLVVLISWTIGAIAIETKLSEIRVVFILSQFALGLFVFVSLLVNRRVAGLLLDLCFSRTEGSKHPTTFRLHTVKSMERSSSQPSVIATGYRQRDSPKSYGRQSFDSVISGPEDNDGRSQDSNDGYMTVETIA